MTVSSLLNKITYQGNASATSFPFVFSYPGGTPAQEAANIQVFFTDANGNITLLIQGSGPTNYQITFNPPAANNPTPSGGTVTYNPNGVPIPSGTQLTIFRNLPVTQTASFLNQTTFFQSTAEGALDYQLMLLQQVLEVQNRALVVPLTDPIPIPLPAAKARANLVLGFDANGNPVAVQSAPQGVISAPMIPVVGAASLSAARTALGLGTIATETIGLGLADNGSGAVQIQSIPTGDSSPQTIALSFHTQERILFLNTAYTLPLSSTLFNGFYFSLVTRGFVATLQPNGADTIDGSGNGTAITIPPGTQATITTNAAGSWFVTTQPYVQGINAASNLQLNASVAGSALTIALKNRDGLDPSLGSPVIFTVGNATGVPTQRAVTAPLSITIPSGATLGTVNGQNSRIWVALFDNAGTPVLGVYNALLANGSSSSVVCWDEDSGPSPTGISAGSTSAQTWYGAVGMTNKAFRIIGLVESVQPTAGAWTATPFPKLFGPGNKKPGDTVQEVAVFASSSGTTTSATPVALSNPQVTLNVSAAANLIRAESSGAFFSSTSQNINLQLSRGTVANTNLFGCQVGSTGLNVSTSCNMFGYDLPNTTGSVTYAVQGAVGGGATLTYGPKSQIAVKEIYA